MRTHWMRMLAAGIVLAAAGTAHAGSVTAVTAPATAVVGAPVTITIRGTGSCSTVIVNYNTALATTQTFVVAAFPFSPPPHTYVGAGTKTIRVTASGNCTGSVTTTIVVSAAPPPPPPSGTAVAVPPSLQHLCNLVPCSANPSVIARPTLTEFSPGSVEPGQMVMLSGSFLGSAPGSIRLRLPNGSPASVTVASWTPFAVTGTLDSAITGVGDGTAQVVVQRSDNVLSNALSIPFVAAREVVQVPNALVRVTGCGDAAVYTLCRASNSVTGSRFDFSMLGGLFTGVLSHTAFGSDPTASFTGFHQNLWDDFGASGDDQFDVTVPSGWTITRFSPGVRTATLGVTQRFSRSDASPQRTVVGVHWSLPGGAQELFYGGWFYAAGPKGVPLVP